MIKKLLILLLLLATVSLHAAPADPSVPVFGPGAAKGLTLSTPMQIVILLTLLTLLPAAIMSVSPFLRIAIVLHFLRQALGTQSAPSNQVLVGLSLFLAFLVMQPVVYDVYHQGWEPVENGQLTWQQGFEEGARPLKAFLLKFSREKDIKTCLEIAKSPAPHTPADLDLKVLIPAYILSEMKAGFQIGAVLFLPFLIIDLVVSSVTLSIGMVQLPPVMISAPFVFGSPRGQSMGRQIMIGTIIGIAFSLGQQIVGHLDLLLDLNPATTMLAPSLLLMCLAVYLFNRAHR